VSLAINDIGERCEAEGIQEDDHDSEHGAGQLNSMHLPIDDAEHQLQVLCDPRQTSTEWRVVKEMNQDAPQFLGCRWPAEAALHIPFGGHLSVLLGLHPFVFRCWQRRDMRKRERAISVGTAGLRVSALCSGGALSLLRVAELFVAAEDVGVHAAPVARRG
jgi:hypothetical protein